MITKEEIVGLGFILINEEYQGDEFIYISEEEKAKLLPENYYTLQFFYRGIVPDWDNRLTVYKHMLDYTPEVVFTGDVKTLDELKMLLRMLDIKNCE